MCKLKVKVKAGSDRIKYKALFSYNSKFLFVPSGYYVKVLCTATGECLRDLIGHQTTVISVQQNPKIRCQIYTCSEDGEVICWDYEDGYILETFHLNFQNPIKAFYIPHKEFSWYVIVKQKNEDFHRLFHVPVKAGNEVKKFLLKPVLPKQNCVSFGPEEEYVASVNDNNLRVLHISSNTFKRHITGTRKLTCVACHPSELTLATGDDSGQILIWNDFLKSNQPSRSVYHWHTLPVEDLTFSVEGSYLYSGGGECVLVKWKIGTELQHFLPRMGFPIKYVTVSAHNAYVASSHIDNGIYLINSQNQIEQIFQGLTQNCLLECTEDIKSNVLLYDAKHHALVLNGKPGSLQFYNPDEDRHLFSMHVIAENYIPQERNVNVSNTFIDKADIDSEGMWLAIAEYRDDKETSPDIRLKFWKFIEESQKYQLNTSIFLPHKKRIKSVKFCPHYESNSPLAVTIGEDKVFKLWSIFTDEDDEEKKMWACSYVGYYHNLMPTEVAFSEDGSVLAVAFEHIVTLWSTETNSFQKTLFLKGKDLTVREMAFGRDTCSHLLVCVTKEYIRVWNLLTFSVPWEAFLHESSCLAADPRSNIMTIFDQKKTLFVFTPDNPNSIYKHKHAYTEAITHSIFFPWKMEEGEGWQKYSQLYYMNEKQELVTLTEEDELVQNPNRLSMLSRYEPVTPFARMVAKRRTQAPVEYITPDFSQVNRSGKDAFSEMLSKILAIPSHMLPPVDTFACDLLEAMVAPLEKKNVDNKDEMDVETEHDVEENSEQCTLTKMDDSSKQVDLKSIMAENYDWLEV